MFELEQEIVIWRSQMKATGIKSRVYWRNWKRPTSIDSNES
jgi:hypothetical protein